VPRQERKRVSASLLRPTWPHVQDPGDLAASVQAATEAGAEIISFYNYGHMRLQSLNWISDCR